MLKDSRSFWNMKSLPNRNVQTSPTILRRMHTRLCPPNGENPHEMRRKDTRYTQSTLHESLTRDNILFRLASLSPPPSLSLSLSLRRLRFDRRLFGSLPVTSASFPYLPVVFVYDLTSNWTSLYFYSISISDNVGVCSCVCCYDRLSVAWFNFEKGLLYRTWSTSIV